MDMITDTTVHLGAEAEQCPKRAAAEKATILARAASNTGAATGKKRHRPSKRARDAAKAGIAIEVTPATGTIQAPGRGARSFRRPGRFEG